jgi:hypothetical protein
MVGEMSVKKIERMSSRAAATAVALAANRALILNVAIVPVVACDSRAVRRQLLGDGGVS